jgi:TP901 family phage tail tape measure protein
MATAKQRLEYEVRLKDLASQALRNMGDNAKKQTTRAQKAFKKLTKAIKYAGLAVVAAFSAAAFMGMRNGIERAREFSKAMGEVNTILGDGGMAIGEASEQVNQLALALGVPAPEVAAGMYQTLSAGVTDSAEAMILLEGATKLGIAGVASTSEAVDLLTTAFNAYGTEVTESGVTAMSDMIFKTVQLGKTTIPELSASMGQVLPMAAQMGVEIEEVAAAVATLTLSGVNTSEAVTQVTAVMTAFLNQGDKYGDLMGSAAFESKSFQEAITDLMNSVDGNADSLKKMMGRAEGVKAVMALTADGGKVLTNQLDEIAGAGGVVDEGFAKMADTMDRKLAVMTEGITQGFAELGTSMLETLMGGATSFEEMGENAKLAKDIIASLKPVMDMVGFAVGVIATGVLGLGAAIHGLVFLVQAAGNALGMISDEDFGGMQEAMGDTMTAMVAAGETTENFGRSLIGMESNGMKATKQVKEMNQELKDANSGLTSFQATIAEQNRLIVGSIQGVVDGRVSEATALDHVTRAYEMQTKRQKEGGFETTRQQEAWKKMIDSGTVFIGKVGAATDAVNGLGDAVDGVGDAVKEAFLADPAMISSWESFSEGRIAANEAYLARAMENEKILDMAMDEGFQKELARIQARSVFEQEAFKNKKEAEALALQAQMIEDGASEESIKKRMESFTAAMDAQVARFNDARTKMEEREVAALTKTTEETTKATEKAQRERLRVLKENAPLIQAAFQGPIALAMHMAVKTAEEEAERLAAAIKGKLGVELAGEMGGGLETVSGFFEMTPTFNLENLQANLAEAEAQVAAAFESGMFTEAQAADMLDMIANVREFKLAELEAADATYKFAKSLEGLGDVEAGVKTGFKNFTDSIPELDEAIANVTEGGLQAFASGITDAFMAFADGSKSASEAFKDFAAKFLLQIAQMIIQMYIMQAIKIAAGFGEGGVVEGGTGEATPLAMGGVVTGGLGRALPVRGYASGGPIVSEPHVAIIGEGKMNEAIVPLPDGRSIPVDMKGGGDANVSFNISAVDARGVDELLVERQDTIRNLIRSAMTEDRVFRNTMQGR